MCVSCLDNKHGGHCLNHLTSFTTINTLLLAMHTQCVYLSFIQTDNNQQVCIFRPVCFIMLKDNITCSQPLFCFDYNPPFLICLLCKFEMETNFHSNIQPWKTLQRGRLPTANFEYWIQYAKSLNDRTQSRWWAKDLTNHAVPRTTQRRYLRKLWSRLCVIVTVGGQPLL